VLALLRPASQHERIGAERLELAPRDQAHGFRMMVRHNEGSVRLFTRSRPDALQPGYPEDRARAQDQSEAGPGAQQHEKNPLPFKFTPEHEAMYEILSAMMSGRRSVAGVSLASLYHRHSEFAFLINRIRTRYRLLLLLTFTDTQPKVGVESP
jgi:hypothetical protein